MIPVRAMGGIAVATQTWSIGDQLRAGIRYLDIRLRRSGQDFAVHHGAFYQQLTFAGVMESVAAFLREHPGETVLMRVKEEYTPASGSESFAAIWERYMASHGSPAYTGGSDAVPTLGQARGRVVFLRDQAEIPARYGISYGRQRIQDAYDVFFLQHRMHNGDRISLPSKKALVKEQVVQAMQRTDGGSLALNHLSGSGGMAPRDVARSVNGEIHDFLAGVAPVARLGVLIMDFPGEQLLYRIVKSNFRFEGRCPARTWRVQSDHSWAEFRLPDGAAVGQVIAIPGGAHNKYRFPKCNRVHWSDLSFLCTAGGTWERTRGSWDADGACHGSKGGSPYVAVGDR